jgi:hypothetical protein
MRTNIRAAGWVAAALLGIAALALSFALHATPATVTHLSGQTLHTDPAMRTVDYTILALRIGGVIVALTAAYRAYRSLRPDRLADTDRAGDDHGPRGGSPPGQANRLGTYF